MIKTTEGEISSDPGVIRETFFKFYSELYRSQHCLEQGEMEKFLEGFKLPTLSVIERNSLDAPITLAEIRQAIADMPNRAQMDCPLRFLNNMGRCWSQSF